MGVGTIDREDIPFDQLDRPPESAPVDPGGVDPAGVDPGGVDRAGLNGHQLVGLVQARQRERSRLDAELLADLAELAHTPPGGPHSLPTRLESIDEHADDEIALALSWTRRRAADQLWLALTLVDRLPAVWSALHRGLIDLPRARVIAAGVDHLPDDTLAQHIAHQALDQAEGRTTGQIAARIRRLCLSVDPDTATRRYEHSITDRTVVMEADPDGTAHLTATQLAPHRATAVMDRLTRLAQHQRRTPGETRTIDQLRADLLCDLLDGTHTPATTSHSRGTVDIRVDLTTLIGLTHDPAHLNGYGPVIADIAHQTLSRDPGAEWRVTITHPDTGAVLYNGTTARRPTTTQRRWIESTHPECAHPLCRHPATTCDLDHTTPRADHGPTLTPNLTPLCRHHHTLKHHPHWTHTQPHPGTYRWPTPRGHTYTTSADPP